MRNLLVLLGLLVSVSAHAQSIQPSEPTQPSESTRSAFDSWLADLRQEAATQGISQATLDAALGGLVPTERVIELDRRQPEFLQTFDAYLGRRITPKQLARGQELLQEHAALLDALEQEYGIPKAVLVAFWGLETHYGAVLGSLNVPASLATLSFEGRRSTFFRNQLLDALRIIDAGHVQAIDMNGSWAGAMGHMQFMPSTFLAYAVDGDADGRIDVWTSLPDAMHSAANYLSRAGWQVQEPVALEVLLPEGFDWRQARAAHRLPVAEWTAMGVLQADGAALPAAKGRAAIVLPQGWEGPAFMVFDNFNVVMRWNRSVNYALTVAQLAHQLAGGSALSRTGETGAISSEQLKAMQQALNEMGFDAGTVDGMLGPRTQTAIRLYQAMSQLPVDGYPSPSVLARIEQSHAEAAAAGKLTLGPAPTFADPVEQP